MMKKDMQIWKEQYPLFDKLTGMEEVFWINPNVEIFQSGIKKSPLKGCGGKVGTLGSIYRDGFP